MTPSTEQWIRNHSLSSKQRERNKGTMIAKQEIKLPIFCR